MKRSLLGLGAAVALLLLPQVVTVPYLLHLCIVTGIYLILALSYDIVVGHVGALSLAHPAFFGIGAYSAAILSTRVHSPFLLELVVGIGLACLLAVLIGVPSFRLSLHSFAIGTLGFAIIAQYIAHNWISLTRGPMCISGIRYPSVGLPGLGTWQAGSLTQQYYFILVLAAAVFAIVARLVHSRIGRAFHAVRDDEALASSMGIHPLSTKLTAFIISAGLGSIAGVFWAHYITIVCPTEMAMTYTVDLLVIVFIGGSGTLRGVILGTILVAFLPEMLRIAPQLRLVLYGAILLLVITQMPDGIDGLIRRLERRYLGRNRQRKSPPPLQADGESS